MQTVGVIINTSSRTASKLNQNDIVTTINKNMPKAKVYIVNKSVNHTINKVIKDGCEVLCAGGGDGTVSAVAAACIKNNLILAVIPLGTMNNFAKDIGMPTSLKEACKTIARQKIKKIDYATLNGDSFINNSSLGMYPRLVVEREKRENRYGKFLAYFAGIISTLQKFRIFNLQIEYDGKQLNIKTPLIFISNNDYSFSQQPFTRRPTLTGCQLSVHIIRYNHFGRLSVLRNVLTKRINQPHYYRTFHTKNISINGNISRVLIARDGEVAPVKLPLEYKIISKQLKVIINSSATI